MPLGQPALSLAAQLQRRAGRMKAPAELADGLADGLAADLPGDVPADDAAGAAAAGGELGVRLFELVREATERGVDPEAELRAVSRVFRDRVRSWERRAPHA